MRKTVFCSVLFAFAFVFAFAGAARPIDVTVRSVAPHQGEPDEGTLVVSAVAVQVRDEPARSVRMSVPGSATIDLPDGVWRLQVRAAGWFHAGNIVTVTKSDTGTVIPIWPLGTIYGKVETSDRAIVGGVTARWTASVKEPGAVPEGELPCALNENEYRCPVPTGTLDVRIGAKGYASQFLWALKVPPLETVTAPLIRLKKGAGAYGWVAVGRGVSFDHTTTTVRLTPEAMSEPRSQQRPIVATVDRRGFFSFSGIDPGAYRIAASAESDSESEERELVIRPDREVELLRPLVLERRVPLRVRISPPTDPSGLAWHVVVTRARNGYGDSAVINQASGDDAGVVTIRNLPPGAYEISVTPKGKDIAFVTRAIEMPRDASMAMEIQTTRVIGIVRMNDQPLAGAMVWLGGKFRTPAVTLTAGADGEFHGIVPFDPGETWLVTVTHSDPSIATTINQRPEREDEETVRLNLVIPAGMIDGVVLEANGSPAVRGIANVIRASDETADVMQARVADGKFELAGLQPGDYTVYAEGPGGRTTGKTIVNVSKDDVSSVKLTFGESLRLVGRLTADNGSAIAGAKVFVNSVEVPAPVWIPRSTSGGGEFATEVPDGTRTIDVVVIAAGFAFKSFRAPLDTGRQLVILMRQNGGRLGLTIPTAAMEGVSGRIPYVVHNGIAIPAMFLLSNRMATSRATDDGLIITAPHVEPGAYGLCFATFAEATSLSQSTNCSFGNLPPFGTIDLSIKIH